MKDPAQTAVQVLIGGVGYRWQGDASVGLVASDTLARLDWPAGIKIEDLGYGAIYVAQDLAQADPPYQRLILLAGLERGRPPGRIYHYAWQGALPDDEEVQARIREAGAGVIDLDHLLVIAQRLEALPEEVIVFEIEPVDASPAEELSPQVANLLPELTDLVKEAALAPRRQQAKVTS